MKLVDLSGVCKARDHQNLGAVFGLLRAVAAFLWLLLPTRWWYQQKKRHGPQEMDDETETDDETPVCNRRNSVRSEHFKDYQIHTYFWGIHKTGVILVNSKMV